jgi:hypothetical protein
MSFCSSVKAILLVPTLKLLVLVPLHDTFVNIVR